MLAAVLALKAMEEMEETEGMQFMDDFFLTSGSKHPSLMEVPFAMGFPWESSNAEKMYVQGKCNGYHELSVEIDMWKLELPLEGKPKFLVRQVAGAWMELRKPRDFYLETMKVVLVAAYFLIFAKQSPNSSKGDVWRYVRKECSEFKAKPHQRDLIQAYLLLQSIVTSDPKLQASPIISQFFPLILSRKRVQEVAQGCDDSRKRLSVKKEHSPVPEAPTLEGESSGKDTPSVEVSPPVLDISKGELSLQSTPRIPILAEFEASSPVVDISKGESSSQSTPRMCRVPEFGASSPVVGILKGESSLQSTPRTCSLFEFVTEADLPLNKMLTAEPKKRKPGRPARRNSRRKRKRSGKRSVVGDDDWIDEPDVCAFCDDGVEKGEKLLCCDGPCMRSFHPTVGSGWQNRCPSLCLTRAAVSVETWICPNCEAGQHQCFACGKLGRSTTPTDSQEVFVCGAKQCKRFYHPVCVAKLLVPEAEQNNLARRIQSTVETFTCPLHKCASCKLDEDKTEPSLCLIKCRRCPIAWHEKCLPEVCCNQLWPLEGGKHVMYCGQHRLDPELLTPKRDHIEFPAVKTVESSDPGGGPHLARAYQTVRDVISESCRAVTFETVKRKMGHFSTI